MVRLDPLGQDASQKMEAELSTLLNFILKRLEHRRRRRRRRKRREREEERTAWFFQVAAAIAAESSSFYSKGNLWKTTI